MLAKFLIALLFLALIGAVAVVVRIGHKLLKEYAENKSRLRGLVDSVRRSEMFLESILENIPIMVFVKDAEEREAAENAIRDEAAKGRWKAPLTTTVEELKRFYPAEDYHQDYLLKNPGGYTCHYWRGLPPS